MQLQQRMDEEWMTDEAQSSLRTEVSTCCDKVKMAVSFLEAFAPDSESGGEILPRMQVAIEAGVQIHKDSVYAALVSRQCRNVAAAADAAAHNQSLHPTINRSSPHALHFTQPLATNAG